MLLCQWNILHNNLVLLTELILKIGHRRELLKLMFWALILRQSEGLSPENWVVFLLFLVEIFFFLSLPYHFKRRFSFFHPCSGTAGDKLCECYSCSVGRTTSKRKHVNPTWCCKHLLLLLLVLLSLLKFLSLKNCVQIPLRKKEPSKICLVPKVWLRNSVVGSLN